MGCGPLNGKPKVIRQGYKDPVKTLISSDAKLAIPRRDSNEKPNDDNFDSSNNKLFSLFTVREEISALENSCNPSPVVGNRMLNRLSEQVNQFRKVSERII